MILRSRARVAWRVSFLSEIGPSKLMSAVIRSASRGCRSLLMTSSLPRIT